MEIRLTIIHKPNDGELVYAYCCGEWIESHYVKRLNKFRDVISSIAFSSTHWKRIK